MMQPCATPGCPEIVGSGHCSSHTSERQRQDRERRGTSAERGYDHTWQQFRRGYLRRVGWRCENCNTMPLDTSQLHVHHIVPLAAGGPRLDEENVQALCASCHNALDEHRQPRATMQPAPERRWRFA